jgi:SagB-type dehydrogenase family enzyme
MLHHIPTGGVVGADPVVVRILDFFREWRPLAELSAQWPEAGRPSLHEAIRRLTAGAFLQRRGRPSGKSERCLESWGEWNPVASLFHFSTRDIRWAQNADGESTETLFRRDPSTGPAPPPPTKRHPGARRFSLPRPPAQGEFVDVLRSRRTWRGFGSRRVALDALARLLDLTWGVQFWGETEQGDRLAFKTSPSGGARHPIEAYLLALRVEGLPRGLYHYTAEDKALELIRPGATRRQVEAYLAGQWFYRSAAAVVFMTAVVERERWRYPNARAYRTLLLDAGHLCQTFCLVATWLGLAPFCTAALADSRVEQALGVDGVNEIVLYAAGVGTRPADGRWIQSPERPPSTVNRGRPG